MEEGEGASHTHTEECVETQSVLICGKPEVIAHTHTEKCYTLEEGADEPVLTCELLQVERHAHNEKCFKTVDEPNEESISSEALPENNPQAKTAVYEDGTVKVTAWCAPNENLPENAKLTVSLVDNEREISRRQTAFEKKLGEGYDMQALLRFGLLVNGREMPLRVPVSWKVEFLNGESAGEQADFAAVAFYSEMSELPDYSVGALGESSSQHPESSENSDPTEGADDLEPSDLSESSNGADTPVKDESSDLAGNASDAGNSDSVGNSDGSEGTGDAADKSDVANTGDSGDTEGPADSGSFGSSEDSGGTLADVDGAQNNDHTGNPDDTDVGSAEGFEHTNVPESSDHGDSASFVQKEKAETLALSVGEDGSLSSRSTGIAVVAIGSKSADTDSEESSEEDSSDEEPDVLKETELHISQSFSYEEDPLFRMVFHVEGTVLLGEKGSQTGSIAAPFFTEDEDSQQRDEQSKAGGDASSVSFGNPGNAPVDAGHSDDADGSGSGGDSSSLESSGNGDGFHDSGAPSFQGGEGALEDATGSSHEDKEAHEPTGDTASETQREVLTISSKTALPANGATDDMDSPLAFLVNRVEDTDPSYQPYAHYIEVQGQQADVKDGSSELPPLQVMSYALFYQGVELDLTDCRVTVEITPTAKMKTIVEELETEEAAAMQEAQTADEIADEVGVVVTALTMAPTDSGKEQTDTSNTDASSVTVYQQSGQNGEGSQKDETEKAQQALLELTGGEVLEDAAAENQNDSANTDASDGSAAGEDGMTAVSAASAIQVGHTAAPTMEVAVKEAGQPSSNTFGLTTSTHVNPNFTVQYYAYLNRTLTAETGDLELIDTDGKGLPQNGVGVVPSITKMSLNADGSVQTATELTKLYRDTPCTYFIKPNLKYFSLTIQSGTDGAHQNGYELKQIWVLKDGKEADSMKREDWVVYGETHQNVVPDDGHAVADSDKLHFTNRPESASDDTIYIKEGTVLRLIYASNTIDFSSGVDFFDYDISEDQNFKGATTGVMNTIGNASNPGQGINNPNNYPAGSGARFAFGGDNTGTGLGRETWGGNGFGNNLLNRANRDNNNTVQGYKLCTFGLVEATDFSGNLTFSSGVRAPNLFNPSEHVTGKTHYPGSLTFTRTGDIYTLSTAQADGVGTLTGLDRFSHPATYSIWTNHFWPLDNANNKDLHFGNNPKGNGQKYKPGGEWDTLPPSDNGLNHNSYFGMHYYVSFDLSEQYVGPLEYYFFGDDDMWVFLTEVDENGAAVGQSKLICDIGGVHTSVGEYVNLWDHIAQGMDGHQDGKYRLDFYYTERGASGSTCWMQFVLPSVYAGQAAPLEEGDYGSLEIKKTVSKVLVSSMGQGEPEEFETGEEFIFMLQLQDGENRPLADDYSYIKYDRDGNQLPQLLEKQTVFNGDYFTLKNGERIVIQYLPVGAQYTITELGQVVDKIEPSPDGKSAVITMKPPENEYMTSITLNGGKDVVGDAETKTVAGVIEAEGDKKYQLVKYDNQIYAYVLPRTGWRGIWYDLGAGAMLLLTAGAGIYLSRKRQ